MTNSNFISSSRTETRNALWTDGIAVFIKFGLIILKLNPLERGARPVFYVEGFEWFKIFYKRTESFIQVPTRRKGSTWHWIALILF
jgi:hypothetical protein